MSSVKTSTIIKGSTIALAVSLAVASANAIEITSTNSAEDLANQLIIPNSGITITSFDLTGGLGFDECGGNEDCNNFPNPGEVNTEQAGIFTNSSNVYGLPQAGGVVFSTGNVNDYADGENIANGATTNYGTSASDEQNALLSEITGQAFHFDPIELNIEFDVAEDVDQISFIAAFGSEEFPDFVNSTFIDGFGMFLNDVNVAGALPTGAQPGDNPLAININHPDFTVVEGTELNGVLAPNNIPLIRFDVPVEPGSVGNTFKLLLADAGDGLLDSTIYLSSFGDFDADSGESEFTPVLPDPSNPTNEEGAFVIELPEVEAGETIWFDPDVATGYVYTATGGGLFASVTAPTLLTVNDPDGYMVSYLDAMGVEVQQALFANTTVMFDIPVSTFTITGIDTDLMLDPTDGAAFVTGVSFSQGGQFGITQLPITTFVPDVNNVSAPAMLALMGLSLAGIAGLRRRRK